ncbi:MAG: YdcF family protein [Rhodobacteraceae bacterium]|nr:MAG: YdcF family protein [Paracoccaceae bacterium]
MSDTLFFIAAKLVGLLIRPESWLVLGCAWTCLAVWRGRGQWVATVTLLYTLAVAVFPLGDVLLARLEARYPAAPEVSGVTGIIVLGGGEDPRPARRWGGVQLNQAGERFTEAMVLARRFPAARVVFTGGSGSLRAVGKVSEAQSGLAEDLFLSLGLSQDRLILESRARNTAENAWFSHDLVQPGPDDRWLLVTSAFHMPRAIRSFERAGWPGLVAWPVDYRSQRLVDGIGWNLADNLEQLNTAVKEVVGLAAYGWTGR